MFHILNFLSENFIFVYIGNILRIKFYQGFLKFKKFKVLFIEKLFWSFENYIRYPNE